jgi:hypothetical protein
MPDSEDTKPTAKKKSTPKKVVAAEESKSEVKAEEVLAAVEPVESGGTDSKPAKNAGDGADNAPAKVAKPRRVTTTIWTS